MSNVTPLELHMSAGPLDTARDELQRRLTRWATPQSGPGVPLPPPPRVSALGDADALRPEPAARVEQRARATIHVTSEAVLIGPWGGETERKACGNCLAVRWQRLRGSAERDALETGAATTAPSQWPLITDFSAAAVWAVHQLVTNHAGQTARASREAADAGLPQVTRVDLTTLRTSTVALLAEPLCPYCAGVLAENATATDDGRSQPPALRLVPRLRPAENVYRLRSPASYGLPGGALVNPVCGVLGPRAWPDVSSPTTAPVAGKILMRTQAGLGDMTWSGKANSFRGSRDLGFLEGLERYASTHRRSGSPLLVEAYDNLREAALDPRDCGDYAPETYAGNPSLSPFDPARPIPWVQGYSLRDRHPILVPLRSAYYCEGTAADDFVDECSNGCAIGSCLEEAVLFGLLEVIERDSFLLAWYRDTPVTEIDLGSCDSRPIRDMVDRAALAGYDIHAFDTRADLAVPVVTSLAVRRDGGPGLLSFAAGAGFDPASAIEAAVSETLTYIPQLPGRVREQLPELEAMARNFDLVRNLPDHSALFGLPQMAQHARSYLEPVATGSLEQIYADWQRQRPRSQDLLEDVLFCRDELVKAGFDVIVVDQTSPEQELLGLRTVRTLVPGLLPMDFGWSRQRAIRMPRLRAPGLRDDALRLVPHPFS
ncbi:ribosomal protein S12 methylthiotransferase accessory factor [Streptacidiphilus sp. MAP12-16]|uniref:TOMM precursor leader peptide-binding protein n=1 Tax=Streptacidiphilus sp. MAP12-16 TaxID=3156300 RepID=UPI0035197458